MRQVTLKLSDTTIGKVEEIEKFTSAENKTQALVNAVTMAHALLNALNSSGGVIQIKNGSDINEFEFHW